MRPGPPVEKTDSEIHSFWVTRAMTLTFGSLSKILVTIGVKSYITLNALFQIRVKLFS